MKSPERVVIAVLFVVAIALFLNHDRGAGYIVMTLMPVVTLVGLLRRGGEDR